MLSIGYIKRGIMAGSDVPSLREGWTYWKAGNGEKRGEKWNPWIGIYA